MRGTAFVIVCVAACGPRAEAPRAPVVEVPRAAPREAARLVAASPVALAADGGDIYYADLEGLWTIPIAGGDARLVAAPRQLIERIVPAGDEVVLVVANGVLAVAREGGAPRTVYAGATDAVAVDDDGVWFVRDGELRVVPRAGGPARVVATGLGAPVAPVVTDGDAVYVAVAIELADAPPMRDAPQPAAIDRIAKDGGARTRLAKRQFGVAALLRRDERLYWTSYGAGLRSVAAGGGGTIRTELGGGGVALAGDEEGIVVQTSGGYLVEVRPSTRFARSGRTGSGARSGPTDDRTGVVLAERGRRREATPGFVLAGGAVVVLVTGARAGDGELWREPRPGRSPITVAGWVTDRLRELVATDDGVVVLDAPLDDEMHGRVLRIDARGRRTVLASGPGMSELAVAGATIAYRAGDAIWSKAGAAAPVRAVSVGKARVLGLVLAGDTLYWSDTQRVQSAPRRGGAATTLYDPPRRTLGTGAPDAQLVVVDGTVYFSTLGWGGDGIQRVVDATTTEPLYEPLADDEVWLGDSLARAGDAIYVSNSAGQIVRAPLAGGGVRAVVTGLEGAPPELAGGGERLVAQYIEDGDYTIAAVDPVAGTLTRLVRLPGEDAAMLAVAPAGDAVYAGLRGSDLIVRIPLPPAGARPSTRPR